MDNWEKVNKTSLPEEYFYSHVNMQDIIYADYTPVKGACKNFKRKKLREML